MKTILLFFLLMVISSLRAPEDQVKYIQISPKSQISVKGDAKITKFTCDFDMDYLHAPTTVEYDAGSSRISFKNTQLTLRNRGFDCGNKKRNKDFHEMLQTDEFPEIVLELKEIILENKTKAIATAGITIAGEENIYHIPIKILSGEISRFRGTFKIDIKDFGLEPIKRMLGLIVVQDIIEIELDLSVTYEE